MRKYRRHEWFDSANERPMFGIQAHYHGKWAHVCEGSKPLIFAKAQDRDAKLKELRAAARLAAKEGRPNG